MLKSDCRIEAGQFGTLDRFVRATALFALIAWHILYATLLARTDTQLCCEVLLQPVEWQALYCHTHRTTQLPERVPTLQQTIVWIGMLGGVGRSRLYHGGRTMSKSTKQSQPDSRSPVDAMQYEKPALSAFDPCERQLTQLNTPITLASSMCRNPVITSDERRRQRTLLELLVDIVGQYQ